MFTKITSSLMVTLPELSQSPAHAPPVGVGVGVGVPPTPVVTGVGVVVGVAVGVGVGVGVPPTPVVTGVGVVVGVARAPQVPPPQSASLAQGRPSCVPPLHTLPV